MKIAAVIIIALLIFFPTAWIAAEGEPQEPVVVNGDVVEYSAENKNVTATGNVSVAYKGTKLTCDELIVNTETRDGAVKGNLRIQDTRGVIEGDKASYNFQNKSGLIDNAVFRSDPYFGRAERVKKVNDREFIAYHGYISTCSLDNPHYRIKSRRINFFAQDKVQTQDDTVYFGRVPAMYIPQFNQSLKDPAMHVQLNPGQKKEWGPYMLSAWRYNLADNLGGRIYFDYRDKLGISEGFGLNYSTQDLGKGDLKYYYTHENDQNRKVVNSSNYKFQRYFLRWRHQWEIDNRTSLTAEYNKVADSKRRELGTSYNFLREYFYQEYEKDAQPLSYALLHRSFGYSSLDIMMQGRTNSWYTQEEKLPQIKYSMPSLQLGDSPFYLDDSSSYVNYSYKYDKYTTPTDDYNYNQFNTSNRLSLPARVSIFNLTPFVLAQQIYTDKSTYGATLQAIFSGGADIATKFYRIFDLKTNFLKLDINGLRHIFTPAVNYTYSNTSTMPAGKARFGGGASIGNSAVTLVLTNRLQTKRNGATVNLAEFKINTSYNIKPKTATGKTGSSLQDIIFDLDLWPYSWMTIVADATYTHSGLRDSANYNTFSNANIDVNFNLAKERSIGFGQRYQKDGGNEFTFNSNWRINPKWKFRVYERYQFADLSGYPNGLREQEYSFVRDLHCWTMELAYNIEKTKGNTIWVVFRMKAFPENEFGFDQTYNAPSPGSQNNP